MFVLASNMWFTKLMRTFFFGLDKIIYNFIPTIYSLLISIARTSILTQADISKMADRIYRLLAVFMVFKVTFSLIMYVVNPDDFSDKSKGVGKLTTNIIISLSLLIITPYIFRWAYDLQTIILEDNSLAVLVFGEESENKSFINSAGDNMAYITIGPFFTPNTSIEELYSCSRLVIRNDSDKKMHVNPDCTGIDRNYEEVNVDSNGTISGSSMLSLVNDSTFSKKTLMNYVAGIENNSLGLVFRQDLALATDKKNENYIMDYNFGISSVVGIVILLLLITFCMDVALRSIKLAFLQLIAPVPILSYVDPKSGKDGMFKKWYQMCFKTFLSLFIRLLALYFAVFIISMVSDGKLVDIVDGSYVTSGLISIFIIIGALMFAKQLPKILEGLGIKLDGDGKFFLNPLKKFSEQAVGGKQILGLGAAAGAAGLAGAVNFGSRLPQAFNKNNWRDKDGKLTLGKGLKGVGKVVGSTIGGTVGAATRGIGKVAKGEKPGKIFSSSYGEAMFAKLQREDLARKGSTIGGRLAADANRLTGNLNAAQRQTLEYSEAEGLHKQHIDNIKVRKENIEREKASRQKVYSNQKQHLSRINERISSIKNDQANVKDAQELVDNMKANGSFYVKVGDKYTDKDGNLKTATAQDVANRVMSDAGKAADDKLNKEKDKAFKWLKANDSEVQQHVDALNKDGVKESDYIKSDGTFNKGSLAERDNAIAAIDAEYYPQLEAIAQEERTENDRFEQELKDKGLDKESAEWKANEADNAARRVKTSQQEGWMPSPDVSATSYVYDPSLSGEVHTTSTNPAPGPRPIPPRGGRPGGSRGTNGQ